MFPCADVHSHWKLIASTMMMQKTIDCPTQMHFIGMQREIISNDRQLCVLHCFIESIAAWPTDMLASDGTKNIFRAHHYAGEDIEHSLTHTHTCAHTKHTGCPLPAAGSERSTLISEQRFIKTNTNTLANVHAATAKVFSHFFSFSTDSLRWPVAQLRCDDHHPCARSTQTTQNDPEALQLRMCCVERRIECKTQ